MANGSQLTVIPSQDMTETVQFGASWRARKRRPTHGLAVELASGNL